MSREADSRMLVPSLMPAALFCLILAGVSASVPVNKCPDHIDCARVGRHFCKPGSSQCGPCLAPLEENKKGLCVSPKHDKSKEAPLPDLDEIDYLLSHIAKQQVSHNKLPVSPSWSDLRFQSEDRSAAKQNNVTHSTTVKPTTHSPTTKTPPTSTDTDSSNRGRPIAVPFPRDSLLLIMMSVCILLGTVALILTVVCWVRLKRESHLAQKCDYSSCNPAGSVSSGGVPPGDKNLAHSAQMYHYQHQKQQMLAMEKHKAEPKVPESAASSDEENEGDFTVYECPGLAPTGEMEVKNPLFDDSAS